MRGTSPNMITTKITRYNTNKAQYEHTSNNKSQKQHVRQLTSHDIDQVHNKFTSNREHTSPE